MTAKKKTVKGPICQVAGCDNPAYLRGLCEGHWNKAGPPLKRAEKRGE
jgi:hypothetical protein